MPLEFLRPSIKGGIYPKRLHKSFGPDGDIPLGGENQRLGRDETEGREVVRLEGRFLRNREFEFFDHTGKEGPMVARSFYSNPLFLGLQSPRYAILSL